jgi:hypothetical protein
MDDFERAILRLERAAAKDRRRMQWYKKWEKYLYPASLIIYVVVLGMWCRGLYRDINGVACRPNCGFGIAMDIAYIALIVFALVFFGYIVRRRKP